MVVCVRCGERRRVTYETAQRIRNGRMSGVCRPCRWEPLRPCADGEIAPADSDIRFWLAWAGVIVPRGMKARAWIREFGVPHVLSELADEAVSEFEVWLGRAL